jgi:hypothetical protein
MASLSPKKILALLRYYLQNPPNRPHKQSRHNHRRKLRHRLLPRPLPRLPKRHSLPRLPQRLQSPRSSLRHPRGNRRLFIQYPRPRPRHFLSSFRPQIRFILGLFFFLQQTNRSPHPQRRHHRPALSRPAHYFRGPRNDLRHQLRGLFPPHVSPRSTPLSLSTRDFHF